MHATGNYQDNITTPIAHENDDEAEAYDDAGGDDDMGTDAADGVLSAIQKVSLHKKSYQLRRETQDLLSIQLRKIVKAVRSSPQHRQTWAREIQVVQGSGVSEDCSASLMLILDVRTRWASTHQSGTYHFYDKP